MSCLFCKIASKEIASSVVFETDNILAFDDISPQAPVHVVVIPKRHVELINDLEDLSEEMLDAVARVARLKGADITGYRTVVNQGRDAGQAVPHLHFHVLGGRAMHWPPG